jgi:hypothetical protein
MQNPASARGAGQAGNQVRGKGGGWRAGREPGQSGPDSCKKSPAEGRHSYRDTTFISPTPRREGRQSPGLIRPPHTKTKQTEPRRKNRLNQALQARPKKEHTHPFGYLITNSEPIQAILFICLTLVNNDPEYGNPIEDSPQPSGFRIIFTGAQNLQRQGKTRQSARAAPPAALPRHAGVQGPPCA